MLGRSLHPTRAQCSAAGPAAGRQPLLQPTCQLLLLTNCQHNHNGLSSSIAQLPVAYGASIAPSRHRQQQQLHNSTHIVRVVALQQDDSFSVDNTRDCFSNSSTQDVLDVVPEAGAGSIGALVVVLGPLQSIAAQAGVSQELLMPTEQLKK